MPIRPHAKSQYKLVNRRDAERMRHIHGRLKTGERATTGHLCDAVNAEMRDECTPCSAKTIQRTLNLMLENFPENFPLVYDKHDKTWRYESAVSAKFPSWELSRDFEKGYLHDNERSLAILLAKRALAQFKGTPFHKGIEDFFDKLAAEIGAGSKERLRRLVKRVSFPVAEPVAPIPNDLWAAIHESMDGNFTLGMVYRSGRTGETERHTVRPLGLLIYGGSWYLLADEPGKERKLFQVARMSEVESLKEAFTLPSGFSLEECLVDSISGYPGFGPTMRVRLRFTKHGTGAGRDMTRWHPMEKRSFDAEGRMVLEFETAARFDLVKKIASWIGHVEVLEPMELREEVQKAGEALAKLNKA